ncbi:MAG: hypothetical protein HN509_09210 [Halobacteriovoraceae bacterium]|nr:hypothetical protein [Halobacteriovoraceae bacterium]MBT5093908.1 hypothetical protein [Halobacteriovoraceae bacterium]
MKCFLILLSLFVTVSCSSTPQRGPASDCKNVDAEHPDYFQGPAKCD